MKITIKSKDINTVTVMIQMLGIADVHIKNEQMWYRSAIFPFGHPPGESIRSAP